MSYNIVRTLSAVALASTSWGALFSHAHAQQPVTIELPGIEVSPAAPKRAPRATTSSGVQPDDVVVSPTALPTPSTEVASSVTVITSQEIEQQQRRTVPDVLRTVPGLNVVQNGGTGGLTSVFMRGTNSNHVKILIDGIDVSDPSNPARVFDLGHLSTADIERIEVLRGPQSGLYGADALGGVISIITKKGEGPPRVTALVEGGSFGTFNQAVGASGSQGRFNYAFNISHLRSTDIPVTPLDLLPPGQKRNNDFYDNWTYSTRLGVDVTQNFSLNWVARYTDARLNFTGDDFSAFPFTPSALQSTQRVEQFFTRGEAVWSPFGDVFKNYFSVAYTDHSRVDRNPGSPPVSPATVSANDGDRIKTDWRGVWTIAPGQIVMFGLEHQNERMQTDTVSVEESNKAGYIELQSQIAKRFFLAANVRYDDNENFGGHTTWRVAPAYIVPGTDTKLKASIGTGFRAPTLNQRFVDFPAFNFFGNPNLQPEESLGYDFGFEQPLLNDRLRFGVTYFHNDLTNLIVATFNPPPAKSTLINVAEATTSGFETFASVVVTDNLRLRADYTYTKAIDETGDIELLRRPRHKASLTATWSPTELLSLSGTVLYTGSWQDRDRFFTVPQFATDAYTIVNIAADYKLNDNATLFGRIDNLFDVQYQEPIGFERPGLSVFGGIRITTR
jgi:vitamin B12 transporter